MNHDFTGKGAIVTGGARGVGAAVVKALVQARAHVAIMDRDEEAGTALAAEIGPQAVFFNLDVTSSDEVQKAFTTADVRLRGYHFLINNAGIQTYGTVTETTEEVWDRTIDTNLKGAYLCAKYALPVILRIGGGVIINVASVQSFLCQSSVAAYTTSKTAMLGLTRSIAVDYAPKVRCVAVCPGTVDTPMLHEAVQQSPDPEEVLEECRQMHLLKRIAQPEEISNLILFLCSDQAAFITGQSFRVDGGLGISASGSKRP